MFSLTHYQGVHQGGTKEYSLYLIENTSTGKSLLVKRWGKLGADGQIKIEQTTGKADALNTALKERMGKGYDMRSQGLKTFQTVKDALQVLPRSHQRSFFNNQLHHLDPDNFSLSERGSFDPMADERDKLRAQMEAQAAQEKEAQAKAAAEAERAELENNPLFGMF
ncbi:WGR domain-containing protein [Rhodobacteraceae bacterium R_SAG4]|nr:WGR domain-containing protein [Rhodobacteraceae bacterium R_SAG4]